MVEIGKDVMVEGNFGPSAKATAEPTRTSWSRDAAFNAC